MEEFIKKVEDLYKRSINKNIVTYTSFLTPAEKQIIIKEFGNTKVIFSGGVEGAERVRAFFLPDYIEELDLSQYITVFRADFSFKKLTHRDFLGALLSLGIERRCIGDIYVFEKEAFFFITSDIAKFIKINLDKVGSIGVKLEEISFDKVKTINPNFKEINFTIASLRIDCVVSGAIKESREKTSTFIRNGLVLLNYLICENVSKEVKEGDIFSIKGYGKFRVDKIGGLSKRGKIFIAVVQYI